MLKRLGSGVGILLFVAVSRCAVAGDVDYTKDVKPLLKRCYSCHSALRQKGDLRLDAAVLIHKGGESGPAIVAGKAAESLLIDAVKGSENEVSAMPPEGAGPRLKPNEIAVLEQWINKGAATPEKETIPEDPHQHWAFQKPIRPPLPRLLAIVSATSEGSLLRNGQVRNPIDRFIIARYAEHGLAPRPLAAKNVLLRRLYLDLIGLPPTRVELQAFLADSSPNAYENVVDRLLESPQHGERWGRHWMDVWRYSDWAGPGGDVRVSQPHIWHWRDWIIESLNADKPYDRMVQEMLAADEIAPTDPDALRATGFLVRNWFKFNRSVWLQNTVEHTGKAFLGLTLNCGVCHEHKYDPITNIGFYRFRAFFEPHDVRTDHLPGEPYLTRNGLPRVFDKKLSTATYRFMRGNEAQPDKAHPLTAGIPAFFGTVGPIKPVTLPIESFYPALRPFVRKDMLSVARQRLQIAKTAMDTAKNKKATVKKGAVKKEATSEEIAFKVARAQFKAARTELASLLARIAAEQAKFGKATPTSRINWRRLAVVASRAEGREALAKVAFADFAFQQATQRLATLRAGQKKSSKAARVQGGVPAKKTKPNPAEIKKTRHKLAVAKKKLAVTKRDLAAVKKKQVAFRKIAKKNDKYYRPLGSVYPRTSSGRRTALARWITSRDNPLAARVAVNHIWMRHFGQPLVSSVFDFGMHGSKPTHPKLLDWLAVEFMESGWRMKSLHRLIVTSAVYRLASSTSGADSENRHRDPDNRYLWRFSIHRVEAEAVRDSILHLAGHLDPTMGGQEIDQHRGQMSRRRSLYFRHARGKRMMFVKLFDGPGAMECYQRNESIVPQQALAMVNSLVAKRESRRLANQLSSGAASGESPQADREFLTAAFEQILSRQPTQAERTLCTQFLKTQSDLLSRHDRLTLTTSGKKSAVPPAKKPHQRARENLVLVLFNHNDFVTIR